MCRKYTPREEKHFFLYVWMYMKWKRIPILRYKKKNSIFPLKIDFKFNLESYVCWMANRNWCFLCEQYDSIWKEIKEIRHTGIKLLRYDSGLIILRQNYSKMIRLMTGSILGGFSTPYHAQKYAEIPINYIEYNQGLSWSFRN